MKIEPNRLTHAQYGGSALRWVETNVYRWIRWRLFRRKAADFTR